jgi:GT2 family glycosyltransferase
VPDPSVLVLVVAHASRTRVREALRSLAAQTYRDTRTVIVGIGNLTIPDDTGIVADVVEAPEGSNFVEAANLVLAQPFARAARYVLLMHDDVSLERNVIDQLVRTADADPTVVAVGAKLVEWDDADVLQEVGASIDRFAIRRSPLDTGEVDAGQRDDTNDVLFCSDACLLVRREALDAVGGLDPDSWPFYEDVDLCWRLRAAGSRVVVAPGARVRHAADLSRGRRLLDATELRQRRERGRLRFMFKHYSPVGLAVLIPQLLLATLARIIAAFFRRELWRARLALGGWWSVLRDLPDIRRAKRAAPPARVSDRELLAFSVRGAVGDVRGERAETLSRFFEWVGRVAEGVWNIAREPVTWATTAAVIIVLLVLRHAIFSGTFALGELRSLRPFADAIGDQFARARRGGLDRFGPAGPAAVVLGAIRSVLISGAFAEKVVLLGPIWLSGVAGARLGSVLGFGRNARRWLGVLAAVDPVTLSLMRDGSVSGLMLWTGSLWLTAALLAPTSPYGRQLGTPRERLRFVARWAFGWALIGSLQPQAFVWFVVLGLAVMAARSSDGRNDDRKRIVLAGALGSFVLLAPWSIEWLTRRTPLVGRPGWLVEHVVGGLSRATLGAGWPLIGWVVLMLAALFLVGVGRTTIAFALLVGIAYVAGTVGAMSREAMLAGGGAAAFVVLAMAARSIVADLHRYELGPRHAAVIGGAFAIGVLVFGSVVLTVPSGARVRDLPIVSDVAAGSAGQVLWLAETTGGLRSWTTQGFSESLAGFPENGGPAERMVSRAIEAARDHQTHRLGGVLALADISHIVTLDRASAQGLDRQADLTNSEQQGAATIYTNDAWQGPAMTLVSPPSRPLSPAGLADAVRDPRRVPISGWPDGPIVLHPPTHGKGVVYVAGGPRGGLDFAGAHGHLAADGAWVPIGSVRGRTGVSVPGRWWRWWLPLEALLVAALLGAWVWSAYVGAPSPATAPFSPDEPAPINPLALVATPLVVALGVGLGWSGVAWGVSETALSSAWYCPPVGDGFAQTIAIVNPNAEPEEFQVRPDLRSPPTTRGRIAALSRRTVSIDPTRGAVVEAYGRGIAVATQVKRGTHLDSSLCASETHTVNAFGEGGRFATRAIPRLFERYIVYNPFPELARASVRFLSPDETIAPPPLQDVRIPPGSAVLINPEEQFEPMLDLSAVIRVWQGRGIVARRFTTVDQVTWSLPVPAITSGVLPRADTADGTTSIIGVNLQQDPVEVKVDASGPNGTLPPSHLDIDPGRRNSLELNTSAARAKALIATVSAPEPVILESLVAPRSRRSVSLMPPVQPGRRWVVPLAERRTLLIDNPTKRSVKITLTRLGAGKRTYHYRLGAEQTLTLPQRGTRPFGLIVSATGPVTAAAVGVEGSVVGVPLA